MLEEYKKLTSGSPWSPWSPWTIELHTWFPYQVYTKFSVAFKCACTLFGHVNFCIAQIDLPWQKQGQLPQVLLEQNVFSRHFEWQHVKVGAVHKMFHPMKETSKQTSKMTQGTLASWLAMLYQGISMPKIYLWIERVPPNIVFSRKDVESFQIRLGDLVSSWFFGDMIQLFTSSI